LTEQQNSGRKLDVFSRTKGEDDEDDGEDEE
jgi:hypothetical protein